MKYSIGSLVKARDREWVVLPGSDDMVILVQPIGGHPDESTGICLEIEKVEPAKFDPPTADELGDYLSSRLLRDAVRFASRNTSGPFRSFSRISITPRPYQLVPLLIALHQNPVRLLIADDVGIGKTIEASLIARELMDRNEIQGMAVLCPPHLAEQWQDELITKFHMDAELVLPSTIKRLERNCAPGESIFTRFPFVVISMDYIKTDKNRHEFIRNCPEFVIVDEAHTCAWVEGEGRGRHQRHELVKAISEKEDRHIVLVTATPHSGHEDTFRSLLVFLNPALKDLPSNLSGDENITNRRSLARHFIQRRRADIRSYLKTETPFPDRQESDFSYELSKPYRTLRDKILTYALETIQNEKGKKEQRIRWWSLLALLRCFASSPAALASTLRSRAGVADAETPEDADHIGESTVLDQEIVEEAEGIDVAPGGDPDINKDERRQLLEMAREAESLEGEGDNKLLKIVPVVKDLIKDGHQPIIFCRFIPTADYVAGELSSRLPKDVNVMSVTGVLPPAEREARIDDLAKAPKHVLVATDCLSEGINLQDVFDAVIHYDLSWNPTRHEQRDGRIDRFGQKKKLTRSITYYGKDNGIDGIVLDVLLRKHQAIRKSLGISVPVPMNSNVVLKAIMESILMRKGRLPDQATLEQFGLSESDRALRNDLNLQWENAKEREKRSRTMFAQESIRPEEVQSELEEAVEGAGSSEELKSFATLALKLYGGTIKEKGESFEIDIRGTPQALKDSLREFLGGKDTFKARFEYPPEEDELWLTRAHPISESISTFVMDSALDPQGDKSKARRAGVIRTKAVPTRTTLLVLRYRFNLVSKDASSEAKMLVEESRVLAFRGSPENAEWLPEEEALRLLTINPDQNITPDISRVQIQTILDKFDQLSAHLNDEAAKRAAHILRSHNRVRKATKIKRTVQTVEPHTPPDILGVYVFLPVQEAGQ
ncbi:MAG: DEAD/DEAH box helicase [Euryarchaeota archaeon]|nr:DEAD/DEAH box helicase [Euryarchaeota archaeon]